MTFVDLLRARVRARVGGWAGEHLRMGTGEAALPPGMAFIFLRWPPLVLDFFDIRSNGKSKNPPPGEAALWSHRQQEHTIQAIPWET